MLDKMNTEQEVDIFNAVKSVRLSGPQFITNQVDYNTLNSLVRFIYDDHYNFVYLDHMYGYFPGTVCFPSQDCKDSHGNV